jgi:phospholipid/cholesterol/gamma-HCH transport system ATP-binding protein
MTNHDGDFPIEIDGLVAGYDEKVVLEVERLAFRRGKVTCIVGPSGCGKTTLLRNVLLLEQPMKGSVIVEDQDVLAEDGVALQRFREHSGVLFQSAALFNILTLAQNVAFPIREHSSASIELAREIAIQKLALVGLEEFADYLPGNVSGGMRKRAGIARAMARDPDYLFLDEPSAGLDPINCAELDELILRIRDLFGTTIVAVTHEIPSLKRIADEAVMLGEGRVLAVGRLDEVAASKHPLIQDFFSRRPSAASEPGTFGGRLGAGAAAT